MNRKAVYEQLKIDEGVVYEVYKDHLGYPTFGVGHLVLKEDEEFGEAIGFPVSEKRVRECFEKDLDTATNECYALYGPGTFNALCDEVQQILVNMMFNMGRPRLSKFKKFNDAVVQGQWDRAADEMVDSMWYRQVGDRAKRLEQRMRAI